LSHVNYAAVSGSAPFNGHRNEHMAVYQRILLAVDLTPDSLLLGQRARTLADALSAELRIIHVVEPLPAVAPIPPDAIVPAIVQTHAELIELARERIRKLGQEFGVPEDRWSIVTGTIKSEIVRAASESAVDLIVIGTRDRHALAFLVRPTEDIVLHRAPCDVLAIRLPDEKEAASKKR
jgi:universal stress protein A